MSKARTYKIDHEEPNDFRWDYVLLPYGVFYKKTSVLLDAKPGDMIRFFQGRYAEIRSVRLIEDPVLCDILCKMRYGISWYVAFKKWQGYAVLEGNGRDILVSDKCIIVAFNYKLCKENSQ